MTSSLLLSSSKKIAFYCNADEIEGMGHFYRSLYYSKYLEDSACIVYFIGRFNELAQQLLQQNGLIYRFGDINSLLNTREPIHYLFVDTYKIDQQDIDQLGNVYQTVFIDDFCTMNFKHAYAVINFTINAPNYKYEAANNLVGLYFFPYKAAFIEVRNTNLKKARIPQRKNTAIAVFFSGTTIDTDKISIFIEQLDKFYVNSEIALVLNQEIPSRIMKNNRFIHYRKVIDIETIYERSSVIFSGGGLVKYESAFCGVPNFSFAINELQQRETLQFADYGLTINVGTFYEFDTHNLQVSLAASYENPKIFERFYKSSGQYFSPDILKDTLINLLN